MDKSELNCVENGKAFDTDSISRLFHNTKKALNTFHAMQQIIAEQADKVEIKDCDIDEKIEQTNKGDNKHG